MRWFFALNEASTSFWDYANLVQVAVHSAREHTSLEPVCLYDGDDNALTDWLEASGVTIIRRRTFLHEWVTDLSPIPRGAYLRLEIPEVCAAQGWNEAFVLYTDCDVVFRKDPGPLLAELEPRFFAAAPEGDPEDFDHFNSGAMWINVAGMRAEMPALRDSIQAHLGEAISPPYDQAALQRHFMGQVDRLPLELNWKPYWGHLERATILHFHGPKPAQKYQALNQRLPESVMPWAGADYIEACKEWDDLLVAALHARPWPENKTHGGRDGFDSIAQIDAGLGDPEPPRPELNQPEIRWGLAPQTTLIFEGRGKPLRFEARFQSAEPDQAVTVQLDGETLTHVAMTRLNDPYSLNLDLGVRTGRHELSLHYAKAIHPPPPDPRTLGVMFRALRVREV
ncbi:MAG: hypothetical protein SynsKO_10160 [Synoicihabitans sp.]